MRKLTLTRKKTLVACLCGVYVYLACEQTEATLTLDGTPCKLMGRLKNGKSIEFEIDENPSTLFVAYSKNFPQRYYTHAPIPAGGTNLNYVTMPYFSPGEGNPFEIIKVD